MMRSLVFSMVAAVPLLALATFRADETQENSPQPDAALEIVQLEEAINQAIVHGEVGFFDCILAEDFTHTSQSGRLRSKAEWMQGREPGKSSYEAFETEDVEVRIYGDVAIVTGLSKARWRETGGQTRTGQFRFLRVWVRHDWQWQAVAFQSTAAGGGSKN